MTLPISSIVNVNISISPTVPPKQGFGTAAIVTNELDLTDKQQEDRIRFYASIDGVGEDWASDSETYICALAYFSQDPSPTTIATIAHYNAGTIGHLRCGSGPSDILVWNTILDGEFSVTVGDTTSQFLGLDFSADLDYTAVALHLQTVMQAVGGDFANLTCTYDLIDNVFNFSTEVIGLDIGFIIPIVNGTGIDLTGHLKGSSADGAVVFNGNIAETEVDALTAGEQASADWYGVLLLRGLRDTSVQLDVAAWTEARTKIFSASTNNPLSLTLGDISNNAFKFADNNYTRTICTYSSIPDQYPDAAVFGKGFPVNFSAPDSVITLKFKPLAGINTEDLTFSQKNALDDKRANALISVGGASMYAEGYMSSQLFFDERHGVDWMTGEIESNVFGYLLTRPTKIPLTDKGGATLEQQVIRSLDAAFANGLLGIGTTSSGEFLGTGYKTSVQKVADMNIADKANRIAPTISFIALLAGAVHFVEIRGVVER